MNGSVGRPAPALRHEWLLSNHKSRARHRFLRGAGHSSDHYQR
jgi:hypothetical protein